jgi:tripartite-type tricarboxylate transporter receptor subunit TctC
MQDVMRGQVDCGFFAGPTVLARVRAGTLAALALSGAKRSPLLPEVPTVSEAGHPGFDAAFSLVLFALKGTPKGIVETMFKALDEALKHLMSANDCARATKWWSLIRPMAASRAWRADSQTWGSVARPIGLQAG